VAEINYVFTISRVAEKLGEDEGDEIGIQLDPEDGPSEFSALGDEDNRRDDHTIQAKPI
jgi:hypothetical protein